MRSDDLAPLIGRRPVPGVGFRQGTVLAWDPQTAANAIDVGGTVVTNLTVLNAAEVAVIKPGDKVSILTLGEGAKTWFVVGRMTIPGGAESGIVRSADYVPATSGYSVNRDGSAEFQDVIARGDLTVNSLVAGTPGAARVEITPANLIQVYDNSNTLVLVLDETGMLSNGDDNSFAKLEPGIVGPPQLTLRPEDLVGHTIGPSFLTAEAASTTPGVFLTSPNIDGGNRSSITLRGGAAGSKFVGISADVFSLNINLVQTILITAGGIILLDNLNVTIGQNLNVQGTAQFNQQVTLAGALQWGATPAIAVANRDAVAAASGTTTSGTFTSALTGLSIMGVTFVAPPSGRVFVSGQSSAACGTLNNYASIDFEVRTGSTIGSGTLTRAATVDTAPVTRSTGVANSDQDLISQDLVSGLTAGSTYNAYLVYKSVTAGDTSRFARRRVFVDPKL